MVKKRSYWRERFEALENAQHKRSLFYYTDLERAYIETMKSLESDILRWYERFAKSEGVTLDEAKRLLKSEELKEFRWSVDDYIKYGQKNAINQAWMKQLENASSRVHISRLESLKLQLQQHVEKLYGDQIEGFERLMKELYSEQYYQTAYEIQKGFNIGFAFQALDEARLTKIISKPWTADNLTFSSKIWRDRGLLIDTLHKELTLAIAKGESPHRLISVIQKKMNTSRSSAVRLVLTEQAFFSASASKDAYVELDVKKYEIIATLDHKTSDICQSLDGKIFKQSDFEPGVTANPFHPRCRTTTAPYFEDDYSQRIARKKNDEAYYITSNIKYPEWKVRFVT
ncbi:MAG: minor capsid protein [Psychrobacillus sp.]